MSEYRYKHSWNIHETPEETGEAVLELEKATGEKNTEKVKEIFRDPVFLRSVVIRRGEKGKAHKVFLQAFIFLIENKFGEGKSIADVSASKLLDFLHEEDFPEQTLNSLDIIAFHSADKDLFYDIIGKVIENEDKFFDKETVVESRHDLASWKSFYEKDRQMAIDLNKKVIEECDKISAAILRKKALFGLANDKEIKHKSKAESFKKTGEEFKEEFNDKYNALRMEMAYSESLLLYAKLKSGLYREKILREAKDIALLALKSAIHSGYLKAEMKISKLLSEIYAEIGDERKAKGYKKRYKKIEDIYG